MKNLLAKIWNHWLTLAILLLGYGAIEFYGYYSDMEERRGDHVRQEVADEVGARLRVQSEARQKALMERLTPENLKKP